MNFKNEKEFQEIVYVLHLNFNLGSVFKYIIKTSNEEGKIQKLNNLSYALDYLQYELNDLRKTDTLYYLKHNYHTIIPMIEDLGLEKELEKILELVFLATNSKNIETARDYIKTALINLTWCASSYVNAVMYEEE